MKLFKRSDKKLCKICLTRKAVTYVSPLGRGNKRPRVGRYTYLRDHDLCGQCYRSKLDWRKSLDLQPSVEVHEGNMLDTLMAWLGQDAGLTPSV